jgi:hypothetical protein
MSYRSFILGSLAAMLVMVAGTARADSGLRVLRVTCDAASDKVMVEPFALVAGQYSHDGIDLTPLQGQSPLVLGDSIYYRIDNAGPIDDACKTTARDVDIRFAGDKIALTETVKTAKTVATVDLHDRVIDYDWDPIGPTVWLTSEKAGIWGSCKGNADKTLHGCTVLRLNKEP